MYYSTQSPDFGFLLLFPGYWFLMVHMEAECLISKIKLICSGPASSASSSWTYSVATPGYPAWSVSSTRPVWYRGQICEISR